MNPLYISIIIMLTLNSISVAQKNDKEPRRKSRSNSRPNISSTFCSVVEPRGHQEGEFDCGIDAFSATFARLPPYLMWSQANEEYHGTIYNVLTSVIATCCGSNISLCFNDDRLIASRVEEGFAQSQHVAFPVAKTTLTQILNVPRYRFLPVMETQGSILFRLDHYEEHALRSSLMSTWRLGILVVFTAAIAGILVWILDRYWNPDEFPKSFVKGGWEGTWWAFVTMTTVGYGDRAPKSIPARIFGLLWMFAGIVLMSLFTAALSASLTADTQKVFALKGAKVGVIRGTLEVVVAYRQGAITEEYRNLREALDAVKKQAIDAALIDMNMAMASTRTLDEFPELVAEETVEHMYGYILQNQTEDVETCFARHTSKQMYNTYGFLRNHISHLHRSSNMVAQETASRLLSPDFTALGAMFGLWAFLFLMCMVWEYVYYRPRFERKNKTVPVEMHSKSQEN